MSLSDLASIGSLVSGIAVLVSLIYLAQQTWQNAKHTRALIHQARSQQSIDILLLTATDRRITELWLEGTAANTDMDRPRTFAYMNLAMAQIAYVENIFYQHREALIDDQRHAATAKWIQYMLTHPGFRAVWMNTRENFGQDFQAFVDEQLRLVGTQSFPDPVDVWKETAALERTKTNV